MKNHTITLFFAALAGVLTTSCGSLVYKGAFKDYSDVYAESQNHQMLLNLARLSQHHPTYFFQSGNIQANYTLTGSMSAQGGQVAEGGASHTPFGWVVNSLQFQGTRTSQPTFNFVPLVGGDFAAHLLVPVSPEVFNAFFQSGFPVDILMRCLVQQVQFTMVTNGVTYGPNGKTLATNTVTTEIIHNNTPTPENTNYAGFLRLCDILRDLQERGFLLLDQRETVTNAADSPSTMPTEITNAPTAAELLAALTNGYSWKESTNGTTWHLERARTNELKFLLTPNGVSYLSSMYACATEGKGNAPYNNSNQIAHVMLALAPESSKKDEYKVTSHVILR